MIAMVLNIAIENSVALAGCSTSTSVASAGAPSAVPFISSEPILVASGVRSNDGSLPTA